MAVQDEADHAGRHQQLVTVLAEALGGGGTVTAEELATAVLAAGWRPPGRVLYTEDELDQLRPDALVADRDDARWIRQPDGRWAEPGRYGIDTAELARYAPVTVVDEPDDDVHTRGTSPS